MTRKAIHVRVSSGRWTALQRGVYALSGTAKSWEQSVFAITAAYGRTASASGVTSAVLLNLIDDPGAVVYVSLPPGQRREALRGVVVQQARLRRSDVRTVRGIRITAPNRTLVDIAGVLTPDQLEAALDTALFRGLTSVPALDRYIRERRLGHRPGVGRLTQMLRDRADGSSQSELERIFLRKLKPSGLPLPKRQFPVGEKFIDIAYPDKRLIIELDGAGSRFTAASLNADRRRQNKVVLALRGWTLLRFTWDDVVNNWPDVEAKIRQVLQD